MAPKKRQFVPPNRLPYVSDSEPKLLRVWNEYFVAGAIWQRTDGIWVCTRTAPILHWMRKLTPASTKLEMARRGCSWEWIEPSSSPVQEVQTLLSASSEGHTGIIMKSQGDIPSRAESGLQESSLLSVQAACKSGLHYGSNADVCEKVAA